MSLNDVVISVPYKALRDFVQHSACAYKGKEWSKNKSQLMAALKKHESTLDLAERGLCCHDENWEFKVHPKCMLCAGTGVVQKELFPERAGLPCDGIPF